MRTGIIVSLFIALSVALLVGCNSQEGSANRGPVTTFQGGNTQPTPTTTQPAQNPSDSARRITADDLHKLWEKHEVLIIDTRNEATYKQSHIKGAILIPANEFATKADELSKEKMIVTYCT
jgi:3-mercaptopyruvate sulfurtransferase SseA